MAATARAILGDVEAKAWKDEVHRRGQALASDVVVWADGAVAPLPRLETSDEGDITQFVSELEARFEQAAMPFHPGAPAASDAVVRPPLPRQEPLDQQKIDTARRQMSAAVIQQVYNTIPRKDKLRSRAHDEHIRRAVLGIAAGAPLGGGVVAPAAAVDLMTAYTAAPPPAGVAYDGVLAAAESYNPPTWLQFVAAMYKVCGIDTSELKARLSHLKQRRREKVADYAARVEQKTTEYNQAIGGPGAPGAIAARAAARYFRDGLLPYMLIQVANTPAAATMVVLLNQLRQVETNLVRARDQALKTKGLTVEQLNQSPYSELPEPEQHVLKKVRELKGGDALAEASSDTGKRRVHAAMAFPTPSVHPSRVPSLPVFDQVEALQQQLEEAKRQMGHMQQQLSQKGSSSSGATTRKGGNQPGGGNGGNWKKSMQCYSCGGYGHLKYECPDRKPGQPEQRKEGQAAAVHKSGETEKRKPKAKAGQRKRQRKQSGSGKGGGGVADELTYTSAAIYSHRAVSGYPSLVVQACVNGGEPVQALVDTGACATLMSEEQYYKQKLSGRMVSDLTDKLYSATDHKVRITGVVYVTLSFEGHMLPCALPFHVCTGLHFPIILGSDLLVFHPTVRLVIDPVRKRLVIGERSEPSVPFELVHMAGKPRHGSSKAGENSSSRASRKAETQSVPSMPLIPSVVVEPDEDAELSGPESPVSSRPAVESSAEVQKTVPAKGPAGVSKSLTLDDIASLDTSVLDGPSDYLEPLPRQPGGQVSDGEEAPSHRRKPLSVVKRGDAPVSKPVRVSPRKVVTKKRSRSKERPAEPELKGRAWYRKNCASKKRRDEQRKTLQQTGEETGQSEESGSVSPSL